MPWRMPNACLYACAYAYVYTCVCAQLAGLMRLIVGFAAAQSVRAFVGGMCIVSYYLPQPVFCAKPPWEWLLAFSIDVIVGLSCFPVVWIVTNKPSPQVLLAVPGSCSKGRRC